MFWNRIILLLAFCTSFHWTSFAQNCTALYGPSQEPAGGTNYLLCSSADSVILDATATVAVATSYTWSIGGAGNNPTASATAAGSYTVTVAHGGNPTACIITFTVQDTAADNPNLGPDTSFCPGDTIALGTTGIYASYAWNTGQITASILTDSASSYQLTVTDANGCTAADTIVTTLFTPPVLDIGRDTIICPGDSIEIGPTVTYASYAWNTGPVTQTIFVQTPNTYTQTVTDANGCTAADSMVLGNHPNPVTSLGPSDTICADSTLILRPGNFYASYLWNDNSTFDSLLITAADTYWVETTDTLGCVSSDTVIIGIHPPIVFSLPPDTSICPGDTITLDAGPGYAGYEWSDGNGFNQTIQVSAAGTFVVTVTDADGCTAQDTQTVFSFPVPPIDVTDTVICPGDTALLFASPGYVTYSWSTGAAGADSIFTDSTGLYSVTVTDTLGCEGQGSGLVSFHALPAVNLGGDDTLCIGQTKVLNAGAGFVTYLWDDNSNLQTRTASGGSVVWVEVEDTNTCVNSDTVTLSLDPGPPINLGNDTAICLFDSILLDPGPGLAPYSWSTTATTQTIWASAADTYRVTVTALNGCTSSDTIIITNIPLPIVDIGPDLDYCEGTTFNQPIDAGAAFVQYNWMDGTTTQINLVDQLDDTVWVEVTDVNQCRNRDTLFVLQINRPPVNLGPDDSICAGQNVILNAGNAGGLVTGFQWSIPNEFGQTVTVSAPQVVPNPVVNTYLVTVTDTNTCENFDTIDVTFLPLPIPDLGNDTAYCFGDPFNYILNPGTFAQYQWSTGAVTPTIVALAFDSSYSVVVTDTNGCSNSDNITVTENPLPNPDLGNDTSYCEGDNFNIILNPGGFASYAWNTGAPDPFILISFPGMYDVTVTDVNGCQQTDDIVITEFPKPAVDLGSDTVICADSSFLVTLDAGALLPIAGFSYVWHDASTNPTFQANDFGIYSVTVTDDNTGCQDSSNIEFISFGAAMPDLGPDTLICEGEVITLETQVNDVGYSYTWNTGATTRTIDINTPGTYWVEMNAINGTCQGIRDSVTFSLGLLPIVELGDDIRACVGQTVVFFDEETAFPDADYLWQDTIPGSRYVIGKSGTYRVKVVNRCGTATDEVTVLFDDCFNIYVPNAFTPNGDDRNEIFQPKTDQELIDYGFRIYDRWGSIVFKTNDINAGWDGRYNNGDELPAGVYVWTISFISAHDPESILREKNGIVTLIR